MIATSGLAPPPVIDKKTACRDRHAVSVVSSSVALCADGCGYWSQSWKNGRSLACADDDAGWSEIRGCATWASADRLPIWLPPSAMVKTRQPLTTASATRLARGRGALDALAANSA